MNNIFDEETCDQFDVLPIYFSPKDDKNGETNKVESFFVHSTPCFIHTR